MEIRHFSDFCVGDFVWYQKAFSIDDYYEFARLSGDENPLHHDVDYAANTPFRKPLVPAHLIAAPLSMIAGMIFPGDPSLYLSHSIRFLKPLFFDEEVVYTAKIEEIQSTSRVLVLRVLVIHGIDVILDGRIQIKSRDIKWSEYSKKPVEIKYGDTEKVALVTGASGRIGYAIARLLAFRGWRIIFHCHSKLERANDFMLEDGISEESVRMVSADLSRQEGQAELLRIIEKEKNISAVVHTASPQLSAPIEALVSVNYEGFRKIAEAALLPMLIRQQGTILTIGSIAVHTVPKGLEDYAAAKSMAATYAAGINRRYMNYGINSVVLALGYVDTAFSEAYRSADDELLLPEQIALAVSELLENGKNSKAYVQMTKKTYSKGRFGFIAENEEIVEKRATSCQVDTFRSGKSAIIESTSSANTLELGLSKLFRSFFELPEDASLKNMAQNITAGWDSLRHIELMLEIERRFNVHFEASDIDGTVTFEGLRSLLEKKYNRL